VGATNGTLGVAAHCGRGPGHSKVRGVNSIVTDAAGTSFTPASV